MRNDVMDADRHIYTIVIPGGNRETALIQLP